jgi:murein DD-endopeptidase MepM/ murein hydrolase activator NlpD
MKRKVCEGRISSKFGFRTHPISGVVGSFHNGVDISCQVGTPIYAPVDCIIEQDKFDPAGGRTLIIRDVRTSDRYGFGHLNEILYNVGQKVERGCIIAKSGNTGNSTGPHLHYTYATGGQWNEGICTGHEWKNPPIEFEL